jgi:hypothetical protein
MRAIGIEALFDMLHFPRGISMDMLTYEFAARPHSRGERLTNTEGGSKRASAFRLPKQSS